MDIGFNNFIENYPDNNLDVGAMYTSYVAGVQYADSLNTMEERCKSMIRHLSVELAKAIMENEADTDKCEKIINAIETIESLFLKDYAE